ncbi:hypothetical protein CORC01_08085 [Colletotrichum orchidophilum]|uniref:Uncharacterized protein n=1 Tax=Colletotrichum orchidophilum TaxID=1209926 RepID=A0A1G4B5A9_9PEZI|nr:uncharacterized protein CORC01_08085 [Colletotrichum orchidophilum]OHE96628.1 hypothetical protein CORC01_08085 [Colletotrichum orchidophilum]
MAAAVAEHPRFFPSHHDALSHDDFETASIRSAAPSYFSDAPSYHSIAPHPEPIPPYSPPASNNNVNRTATSSTQHPTSLLPAVPAPSRSGNSTPQPHRTTGLPPIPPVPPMAPRLDQFRIPTWSTVHTNPTLNNVARRRMNQGADPVAHLRRFMSERMAEEEAAQRARDFRPLEDPYLVGEEAAASARRERLARESGEDILWDEDRRWNRFLAQMQTWEDRDRSSWRNLRQPPPTNQRKKLTRRLAGRLW